MPRVSLAILFYLQNCTESSKLPETYYTKLLWYTHINAKNFALPLAKNAAEQQKRFAQSSVQFKNETKMLFKPCVGYVAPHAHARHMHQAMTAHSTHRHRPSSRSRSRSQTLLSNHSSDASRHMSRIRPRPRLRPLWRLRLRLQLRLRLRIHPYLRQCTRRNVRATHRTLHPKCRATSSRIRGHGACASHSWWAWPLQHV